MRPAHAKTAVNCCAGTRAHAGSYLKRGKDRKDKERRRGGKVDKRSLHGGSVETKKTEGISCLLNDAISPWPDRGMARGKTEAESCQAKVRGPQAT